jgi:hypothetical protein
VKDMRELRAKESAELEDVRYSAGGYRAHYAVRIGPAYTSRKLGEAIVMRRAAVDGCELEFEATGSRGPVTNIELLQKRAIRKHLRMAKTNQHPHPKPRQWQTYEAELDRALQKRDNWELRIREVDATISPLRVKMPLSQDRSRRDAQREIITIMSLSHSLLTAAKKAIACIDQGEASQARSELQAVVADISSRKSKTRSIRSRR